MSGSVLVPKGGTVVETCEDIPTDSFCTVTGAAATPRADTPRTTWANSLGLISFVTFTTTAARACLKVTLKQRMACSSIYFGRDLELAGCSPLQFTQPTSLLNSLFPCPGSPHLTHNSSFALHLSRPCPYR
ncbi:hypothetical protein ElyMa_005592800 [Elysia marginata]|uniref:Uncharacterized protein n=1 Tax=Elysia marginata TaxID=1093978 RepID=A0AAV4F4A3_9GAST|nr:hypothetical protein ElyMa_005592800 [Elysia marginata]